MQKKKSINKSRERYKKIWEGKKKKSWVEYYSWQKFASFNRSFWSLRIEIGCYLSWAILAWQVHNEESPERRCHLNFVNSRLHAASVEPVVHRSSSHIVWPKQHLINILLDAQWRSTANISFYYIESRVNSWFDSNIPNLVILALTLFLTTWLILLRNILLFCLFHITEKMGFINANTIVRLNFFLTERVTKIYNKFFIIFFLLYSVIFTQSFHVHNIVRVLLGIIFNWKCSIFSSFAFFLFINFLKRILLVTYPNSSINHV